MAHHTFGLSEKECSMFKSESLAQVRMGTPPPTSSTCHEVVVTIDEVPNPFCHSEEECSVVNSESCPAQVRMGTPPLSSPCYEGLEPVIAAPHPFGLSEVLAEPEVPSEHEVPAVLAEDEVENRIINNLNFSFDSPEEEKDGDGCCNGSCVVS
jgi:hypothetical protein